MAGTQTIKIVKLTSIQQGRNAVTLAVVYKYLLCCGCWTNIIEL